MRQRLFAIACIALGLALSGCATLRLPERFVIADEGWIGVVRLQMGDVVYLTISVKGQHLGGVGDLQNPYPLWSDAERIPLRLARGPLTTDEVNLLMGFLTAGAHGGTLDSQVPVELEKARPLLWDALVSSLILSRTKAGQPGQLQVRMDDEKRSNGEVIRGFCSRFKSIPEASLLSTSFFVNECDSSGVPISDRDIRFIRAFDTPLGAVTDADGTLTSPQYLAETVAVSVARVERRGAAMRNRSGQEARWSLADWQSAGICVNEQGNALRIIDVVLRTEQLRWLRVMPANTGARFDIQPAPIGERTPVVDAQAPSETLSQESLKFLSPGDVAMIRWGAEPTIHPPNVGIPLSSTSRDACNP